MKSNTLPPWARRRTVRPKRTEGIPGGNWDFELNGQTYSLPGKFVQDARSGSDDGKRWIATRESNREIRRIVCELAGKECQLHKADNCWKWAPVHLGQPHHVRHCKMGGAFTDDRIFIFVDGERTVIRVWSCPTCHRQHHNPLHWGEAVA